MEEARHDMRIIFALMDRDGDGTISLEEFQAAHECPRGDRSARCDASLSAQILAGPEPDRDAFQQAQGLSAQGRRTNNSAPAPPDRQIRAYPHYPRSFQLFQACRLCVKSTGICSRLVVRQSSYVVLDCLAQVLPNQPPG